MRAELEDLERIISQSDSEFQDALKTIEKKLTTFDIDELLDFFELVSFLAEAILKRPSTSQTNKKIDRLVEITVRIQRRIDTIAS